MRRFEDSTFVFVTTNHHHGPDGVEHGWIEVIAALVEKGAAVRLIALKDSPVVDWARTAGAQVDPYLLDRWNVVRARSRLRKYLQKYAPVVAHSAGLEADLLLRWASRTIPHLHVVHTLPASPQFTRRRTLMDRLMRRFDELGMRKHADAVFAPTEEIAAEVRATGIPVERVLTLTSLSIDASASVPGSSPDVEQHLRLYRSFMAERGPIEPVGRRKAP